MKRIERQKIQKIGLPPGTLIYTGEKTEIETKISLIDYNSEEVTIEDLKEIDTNLNKIPESGIRWINVSGLSNVQLIEDLGKQFNLQEKEIKKLVKNPKKEPR